VNFLVGDTPFQIEVLSTKKAFEITNYDFQVQVIAHAPTRSKAIAAFAKEEYYNYHFDSFLEFCNAFKVRRAPYDDAVLFQSLLESPLSDVAAQLLTSTTSHLKRINDLLVLPTKKDAKLKKAVIQLIDNGLIEIKDQAIAGVDIYAFTSKGIIESITCLSATEFVSYDDAKALCRVIQHKDIRISLCTLKKQQEFFSGGLPRKEWGFLPKEWEYLDVNIKSEEWGSWWCSNCSGYTNQQERIGLYSFKEAIRGSYHCGASKGIVYLLLEDETAK